MPIVQASLDDLKTPLWQRFRSLLSPKDDREFLSKLKQLSGKRPVYRLIDDAELLLTLFAAPSPHGDP
ncbi:hypothetical protein RCF98_17310 [Thiothrix lacustris]|jgi:hypothetical protein|uniref:Uncharacterized protein n=2 Tax=Thiothrix lacustris TaxID=525917 RepID=A0ABY9MTK5_9GAMM|nr:hypothetical protein RCF98_17310 [Thiothrix lacustris]